MLCGICVREVGEGKIEGENKKKVGKMRHRHR